jgi:hypothetical protein
MNYLLKNLNNSLTLPVDVMKIIYEYADPFIYIKKQIENKSYKLNISYRYPAKPAICGLTYFRLNYYNIETVRITMIKDLQKNNIYKTKRINWNKYKMKDVYKKWLKL